MLAHIRTTRIDKIWDALILQNLGHNYSSVYHTHGYTVEHLWDSIQHTHIYDLRLQIPEPFENLHCPKKQLHYL